MRGASATISWVMPVMWVIIGGMGRWGLTSVWNVPTTLKPSMRTAPISVILLVPARAPVVSRSSATKGTSARSGSGSSQCLSESRSPAVPGQNRWSCCTSAARTSRQMGSGAAGEARSRRAASTASRGSPRTSRVSWSLSATAKESCSCIGPRYIP